jgi:hypothetical protein
LASAVVRSMTGRWKTMACDSARGQRSSPAAGMQQAVDQAQQGALAGAVGAEHHGALRGQRQRHVLDDARAALGQAEAGDRQPGAHPHRFSAQPRTP